MQSLRCFVILASIIILMCLDFDGLDTYRDINAVVTLKRGPFANARHE
jgi:hypothetical protein